jgi:hypothetical protein
MAKRLTDTEKWRKPWFRNLKPKHKCFWQYLIDNCNHAGVWEVDFNLASYFIGTKLEENELREVFKKQYVELDNGKRWFIRDFVEFQYGCLNPNNNLHKSVINTLEKSGVDEGLVCPTGGAIDKEEDKDKEIKYVEGDLELATLLRDKILENTPTFKEPNIEKWAEQVRLMRERDGRTYEQIKFLIDWSQKNNFWQANILSTKKLREKFDVLVAQVKRDANGQSVKKATIAFT